MKNVFWFVVLSILAVVVALWLGGNQSTVSVFWHPWRIDVSLNLVLFVWVASCVLLYMALRGMAVLRQLPQQAHVWRMRNMERAAYVSVLDAVVYQLSGRFVRAKTASAHALQLLGEVPSEHLPQQGQLQVLAQLLAAESAHALGNTAERDGMLQAIERTPAHDDLQLAREGAFLRAASWALDERDTDSARHWLGRLTAAGQRRIRAVRLRLKLAQQDRDAHTALDLMRVLVKHRAVGTDTAATLMRSMAFDTLSQARDRGQLMSAWQRFDATEHAQPEWALAFIKQWQRWGEDDSIQESATKPALEAALHTAWQAYHEVSDGSRTLLLIVLDDTVRVQPAAWFAPIEAALAQRPNDAGLQFVAGQVFFSSQLWGKAQQQLTLASKGLTDAELLRRTWISLAMLSEQKDDAPAAMMAWKQAALLPRLPRHA